MESALPIIIPKTLFPCSAGVGRTGCFISLDTLLQHIKDYDWIDIFGLACEIRQHRNHMIQTEVHVMLQLDKSLSMGYNTPTRTLTLKYLT